MQREAFNTDRPALTLPEWAALPLHRLLASAGIDAAGALTRVGGLAAKTAAASQARTVVAFAVHADQVEQCVGPHGSMPAADVVGATTLPTLAGAVEQRTSNAFGPVVELPRVLTETAQPGAGEHWSKSFDYRASSFCRFEWLEALVLGALRAEPVAEAERASPPSGVLCKYARKGYVHVLGTAGCGKTSWALNWVRHSTREYAAGPFPPLAGWYFARREGESAFDHGDEFSALQNLISLARRQLDVLPRPAGSHDPLGTPLRLLSDDERAKHRSRRDPDTDDLLRDRFLLELRWLAQQRPPTAETPLLFLIDGGDEMWGTGAKHQRWDFPRILPTVADLPEHVYIVLLSRPGDHMLGFHGKTPLLRYVFTRADVDRVTRQYLNTQARHLQRRLGPNEASDLLRDEQLQENICNASEGAFGYVTLLLRQWLPDAPDRVDQQLDLLRRWRHQQDTLPEGIYGLRAREFMTMLGQPLHSHPAASEQDDPGLAKALALITQLRWPLSRSQLLWLLYPNTLPGETDPPGAKALRARLQQGGGWLAGVDMDADHEPMYFGHQSLREVVLAAWRLHARRVACNEATLSEEARALATERNEFDAEPESPLDQERQRADATLHAVLAGASNPEREPTWVKQVRGQATKPVVRPQERLDTAQAYDWTWVSVVFQ